VANGWRVLNDNSGPADTVTVWVICAP
jgi:hypothetical protein